jgi:ribosomal protein RSM22 (predicted rRNA methylase)
MGGMSYPELLERFWREEARVLWGDVSDDELVERVRPLVQALSDRFTVDRARAPELYGDDPALRVAYGLFFFPQTFARAQLALRECWRPPGGDAPVRILDIGAGTGAAGFAALHLLGSRPAFLRAVDRAARALESLRAAAAACRELWPQAVIEVARSDAAEISTETGRDTVYDVILCSFALSEIADQHARFDPMVWTRTLLSWLSPDGLLLILEPALKSCAERLEVMRDRVAMEGWGRIVGPCMHHAPCPLRAEGRFWCHEVRRWRPPPLAEKINRTLFRDLPNLKFSFLALRRATDPSASATMPADARSPSGEGADDQRARLVAPVVEQRGKFLTRGCFADGRLREIELLTRHLRADARAAVDALERGSRVHIEIDRQLGNGGWRATSVVEIDSAAPCG